MKFSFICYFFKAQLTNLVSPWSFISNYKCQLQMLFPLLAWKNLIRTLQVYTRPKTYFTHKQSALAAANSQNVICAAIWSLPLLSLFNRISWPSLDLNERIKGEKFDNNKYKIIHLAPTSKQNMDWHYNTRRSQ